MLNLQGVNLALGPDINWIFLSCKHERSAWGKNVHPVMHQLVETRFAGGQKSHIYKMTKDLITLGYLFS